MEAATRGEAVHLGFCPDDAVERLLLDFQARYDRRLPTLRRATPASLPRRVRFPLFERVRLGIDDTERTRRAIAGAEGKRLTYRRTRSQAEADEIPF
jgi:hypothetical protein